jgi:glycosyltransferase involved in cell wall biosynthesis
MRSAPSPDRATERQDAAMKVSVITVAYNAGGTIGDTLRSVARQSYPNIEHIVVDGGSNDRTMDVVRVHASPYLRSISEPDRGIYDAMNKGLSLATGDLIGFLNADDFLADTNAIADLVAALEPDAAAVCGATVLVSANDPTRITRFYSSKGYKAWMLRFGHMPPHPAFYARRAAMAQVGPFDPTYRIGGDFEWMVRFFHVHRNHCVFARRSIAVVRNGGVSNRGLESRIILNREALRSCRRWGLRTNPVMLWSRYLLKSLQLVRRPGDYPATAG